MKRFKAHSQFINELNRGNIVTVILDSLEPTIVEMLAATEKWFVETFKQEFTKYDRDIARINLTYDMIKSIEMYTLPTDQLVLINVRKSAKGNIEISSQIQRGEIVYSFQTEAIYAGGHNVQRLHYRYIIKTNIPKTGASEITKGYADEIKKMSKLEQITREINTYEQRIETEQEKLEVNSKLTDNEIKEKSEYVWPTWKEIVKRDAAKNYNNDEAYYYKEQEKSVQAQIDSWKRINVVSIQTWLVSVNKSLQRLIAKRDSMV